MTYFVGIVIAKFKHDCFIQDHNGVVIRHSFSFRNNQDGFNILLDALNGLDHSQEIKIGLEATGHYGSNIKQFHGIQSLTHQEVLASYDPQENQNRQD